MDKSDDSAAVRNGVSRLVDLIFRGQYIPKGALVIFDGLNKELCVGIHLVVIRIVHLGLQSGWLFCALYLKQAASSLMMAYGGDEFVHPDNAVPVYLARSGYPRIIPSHHRRMILKKDDKADMLVKFYFKILSLSKIITLAKKVDKSTFSSINNIPTRADERGSRKIYTVRAI